MQAYQTYHLQSIIKFKLKYTIAINSLSQTEKHRNTKKDCKIKYTHKNYNSNIPTQKNGKTAKEAQLKKDPANTLKILQAFKIIICYVAFYPSETAVVKIVSLFLEEN